MSIPGSVIIKYAERRGGFVLNAFWAELSNDAHFLESSLLLQK
jgi:hypothetical protein